MPHETRDMGHDQLCSYGPTCHRRVGWFDATDQVAVTLRGRVQKSERRERILTIVMVAAMRNDARIEISFIERLRATSRSQTGIPAPRQKRLRQTIVPIEYCRTVLADLRPGSGV